MTLQELQRLLRTGKADKTRYKEYALLCHPDLADDPDLARSVFVELQNFMEDKPLCILKGKQTYKVLSKIAEGSLSDIYSCDNNITLKVGLRERDGRRIKNEFATLEALKTDSIYGRLFPKPVELLKVDRRDAAAYVFEEPIAPLAHWGKLPGHHIAWIAKRTLMALGHAHSLGYCHGCLDASHILITYESHGVVLCGWGFSSKIGSSTDGLPKMDRHKDSPLTSGTDIYMMAATLKNALDDSDKSKRLAGFFDTCLVSQKFRPSYAWDLHDELDAYLRRIFGSPKFVELKFFHKGFSNGSF